MNSASAHMMSVSCRRLRISWLIGLVALAMPAAAAEFNTGRDLVDRCTAELPALPASEHDKGAPRAEGAASALRCQAFLQGYFRAVLAPDRESGISPYAGNLLSQRNCMRLPDFISYRDLAQILIDYARNAPDLLNASPDKLAGAAYQARFPCERRKE